MPVRTRLAFTPPLIHLVIFNPWCQDSGSRNLLNRYCRLKQEDITYIFDFAEVDSIIVDHEFVSLLDGYKKTHPQVPLIIDNVSEARFISGDDSAQVSETIGQAGKRYFLV